MFACFVFVFNKGITAVICTYPLDMVRVRLAFQVKGEHKYMGIIHAFKMIYTKVFFLLIFSSVKAKHALE